MSKSKASSISSVLSHLVPHARTPLRAAVKIRGFPVWVYSIGFLAGSTGRQPRMLLVYEKNLVLPRPILPSPTACRWYTADEITQYGEIFRRLAPTQGMRTDKNPERLRVLRAALSEAKRLIKRRLNRDLPEIARQLGNPDSLVRDYRRRKLALDQMNNDRKTDHENG